MIGFFKITFPRLRSLEIWQLDYLLRQSIGRFKYGGVTEVHTIRRNETEYIVSTANDDLGLSEVVTCNYCQKLSLLLYNSLLMVKF